MSQSVPTRSLNLRQRRILWVPSLGLAGFVLAACSSAPVAQVPMANAEAAVQRASTAATQADAPTELGVANAKLMSARQAAASQDVTRARQLAEQAEVDAEVAVLHAQSERSRKAAQESRDAARALRDEIDRKPAAAR
jgi:hypothetical protein